MPLHTALVLSLAFHLALYTLADLAGLHAPPMPQPRPLLEAMLLLPELPPEPEAIPEPAPEVLPPVATAQAPATPPPAAPPVPAPLKPAAALTPPPEAPKPAAEPPRYYPLEAVRKGLEGEVLVSVSLDAAGNVRSARLERGSGHAILDAAALRATRTLRGLPGGAGEAVLPVRFKLK